MTAPAYGVLRRVSDTASVLLENNPSSMTLEGTNTWVLARAGLARRRRRPPAIATSSTWSCSPRSRRSS